MTNVRFDWGALALMQRIWIGIGEAELADAKWFPYHDADAIKASLDEGLPFSTIVRRGSDSLTLLGVRDAVIQDLLTNCAGMFELTWLRAFFLLSRKDFERALRSARINAQTWNEQRTAFFERLNREFLRCTSCGRWVSCDTIAHEAVMEAWIGTNNWSLPPADRPAVAAKCEHRAFMRTVILPWDRPHCTKNGSRAFDRFRYTVLCNHLRRFKFHGTTVVLETVFGVPHQFIQRHLLHILGMDFTEWSRRARQSLEKILERLLREMILTVRIGENEVPIELLCYFHLLVREGWNEEEILGLREFRHLDSELFGCYQRARFPFPTGDPGPRPVDQPARLLSIAAQRAVVLVALRFPFRVIMETRSRFWDIARAKLRKLQEVADELRIKEHPELAGDGWAKALAREMRIALLFQWVEAVLPEPSSPAQHTSAVRAAVGGGYEAEIKAFLIGESAFNSPFKCGNPTKSRVLEGVLKSAALIYLDEVGPEVPLAFVARLLGIEVATVLNLLQSTSRSGSEWAARFKPGAADWAGINSNRVKRLKERQRAVA